MLLRLLISISLIAACATSAAAQERQWTLDASDQDAYLIFGVPESDDVGVSLWCRVQQGEINIFVPDGDDSLPNGQEVTLTLTADGVSAEIKGKTDANLEAGTTSVEAKAPDNLPIFAAMLKADRFHVKTGAADTVFPLIDADLQGLLDLCRKP